MVRAIDKWLVGYLRSVLRRPRHAGGVRHLVLAIADHYEPFRGGVSREDAVEHVKRWQDEYAVVAGGVRDADGCPPRHTFFYPCEEYDRECLDRLGELCSRGYGEVEIHLHHRNDTAANLRKTLTEFRDLLHREHGLLGTRIGDGDGEAAYGFVHGNWALCNSRPDGDWCGVNEELGILSETGCYADFTFPSAPSPTQPRMVNTIYRAMDSPGKPRGHDKGHDVKMRNELQLSADGRGLMLIQGPLGLDWNRRKWGVLPRLENAELSGVNPPTSRRADLWVKQNVHVSGLDDWVFVKLHTHGCVARNTEVLLGNAMSVFHEGLCKSYSDGALWQLHYATCREMYNMVRAAEDGHAGSPGEYRDYEVGRPSMGE